MLSSSPPSNTKSYMRKAENILNVEVNKTEKECRYIHLHPSGGVEECSIIWNDHHDLRSKFHKIKVGSQFKKVWKLQDVPLYYLVMYCSKIPKGSNFNQHILPYGLKNDFFGSIYLFKERNEYPHDFSSLEYTRFFEDSFLKTT